MANTEMSQPAFDADYDLRFDQNWESKSKVEVIGKSSDTHPLVARLRPLLPDRALILDLGSETGRHTFPFARAGHDVVAVDRSEKKIKRLNEWAVAESLPVTTEVDDIRNYLHTAKNGPPFHGIIASLVLHYLSSEDASAVITNMQARTAPGGVNVLISYGRNGVWGKADQAEGINAYYPANLGELLAPYTERGWSVIHSASEFSEIPNANQGEE